MRTRPIPIRMEGMLLERVRRVARRMGTNRSAVVRLALLVNLPELEGGHLRLPPEMKEREAR
jgi:predicted DNA-binding protein